VPRVSVDGVLFDIDDTLVDTRGAFGHALRAIAHRYLPDVTSTGHDAIVAHWRADAADHFRAYTRGEETSRGQRMARANELHAAFGGQELDDVAFTAWNTLFEDGFERAWRAHADVTACLDVLETAGVAVGALSNAAVTYQTHKLARVGLAERVPMLVGVDTLGVGKPDPRVFVEACRRLGTEPSRTAYVGDELDVDACAARAAGLLGVWVDRPGGRRQVVLQADLDAAYVAGVVVVTSLLDLPGVLGV